MSKIRRNSYKFMFPSPDEGKRFLKIANEHTGTDWAQHPLVGDGSTKRDETVVIVTGTQSVLFDVTAIASLEKAAVELAGALVN